MTMEAEVQAALEGEPTEPTAPVEGGAPEGAPVETPPAEPEALDLSRFGEDVDEDLLTRALDSYRSLQTEDGITDAFVSMGLAMGASPEQIIALFDEAVDEGAPPAPAGEPDDDTPLTAAQVMEMVQGMIQEAVLQPLAARDEATAVATIRGVIQDEMTAREITDDEDRRQVLGYADRYLDDESRLDPAKVKAAIEKGAADYDAFLEARVKARLEGKAAVHAQLPTPLSGGGTAGADEPDEPKNMEDAKARVRANLRARGEL